MKTMDKYTYSNLIIDPTKEGIESLIGKEVYCHDNPCLCLKNANKKSTDFLGVLVEIHKYNNVPFCVKQKYGVYKYTCIIEKKEESKPKYVPFESVEEFLDSYFLNKEKYTTGILLKLEGVWLREKETGALYMATEIWDEGLVIGDTKLTISGTNVFNDMMEWDELFNKYSFLDGSPCGKEVEE